MHPRIGVLDSGIGGLSVLNAIQTNLPQCHYTYIADQKYLPYGNKNNQTIICRIINLCKQLSNEDNTREDNKKGCDIIVIACNTATAIAIETIRPLFNIPIIGIEPAIKPAALATKTNHIAICATQNMIDSQRLNKLIEKFGSNKTFYKIACPTWVDFVESGSDFTHIESNNKQIIINDIKEKFIGIENCIDHLILGCTHFPFLAPFIREALPKHIQLVDPASAIALRVEQLLIQNMGNQISTHQLNKNNKDTAENSTTNIITCYSSADPQNLSAQMQKLSLNFYDKCQFRPLIPDL